MKASPAQECSPKLQELLFRIHVVGEYDTTLAHYLCGDFQVHGIHRIPFIRSGAGPSISNKAHIKSTGLTATAPQLK